MSHVMRKPVSCHIRTTNVQISLRIHTSDQRLCCTLSSTMHMLSKSKISRHKLDTVPEQAESYLVGNPIDRISHDMTFIHVSPNTVINTVDNHMEKTNTYN